MPDSVVQFANAHGIHQVRVCVCLSVCVTRGFSVGLFYCIHVCICGGGGGEPKMLE